MTPTYFTGALRFIIHTNEFFSSRDFTKFHFSYPKFKTFPNVAFRESKTIFCQRYHIGLGYIQIEN